MPPPGGDPKTDDHFNTETDEGTTAMHKKRARRVSFAELTSVHVFVRDSENETPTDPAEPSSPDSNLVRSCNGLGLLGQDSSDAEYSKESTLNDEDGDDDGDDECRGRRLFLQPMESPSPGGSTMGSATSNDDDDFFGPVSASFIRPGRLSDSAVSDESHDRTMDSTAFSMHFRSLARSDSGDMTAPTAFQVSVDERTPIKNPLSTTLGSSMTLTTAKNAVSDSSACINKWSTLEGSSGMSLVGKDSHKYDYAKLSPGLEAILAECRKHIQAGVVHDNTSVVKSPINNKSTPLLSDVSELVRSQQTVTVSKVKLNDENNGFLPCALAEPADGFPSNIAKAPGSGDLIDQRNSSSEYSSRGNPHMNTDGTDAPRQSPVICNEVFGIISNDATEVDMHEHLSLEEKLTPLSARTQMDFASFSPSNIPHVNTPIGGTSSSLAGYEVIEHIGSISSVQRSISRLKMLETSPFSASVKVRHAPTLASSYLSKDPPPTVVLGNVENITCMEDAVAGSSNIKPYADPFTPQKNNLVFKMYQNPASPEECIDSHSNSLTLHDGDNANTCLGHDVDLGKKIEHGILSAIPADNLDTFSASRQSKSPSLSKSEMSIAVKSVCDRDVDHCNTQDVSEALGNDMTHLIEIENQRTHCFSSDTSLHVQMDHTSEGKIEKEASSCGIDSQLSYMICTEPQQQALGRSPLKRQISNMTNNEGVRSLGLPPANHGEDANLFENIVERKRRRDDMMSSKKDPLDVIVQIQSSPKLRKVAGGSETLDLMNAQSRSPLKRQISKLTNNEGVHSLGLPPASHGEDANLFENIVERKRRRDDMMSSKKDPLDVIVQIQSSPKLHKVAGGSETLDLMNAQSRSPLKRQISKMTNNEGVHSLGLPPANHGEDANLFENIIERKRRRDDMISSKKYPLDEIVQIQSSSKLHKGAGGSEALVEQPEESANEMFTKQERTKLKHWDDIFSKFVADKSQLVSPLHYKASLQIVGQLLDLLVQQQRLKQYEFLCMEILPKKLNLDNHQQKRVAEARKLLHRISHKHAGLQLMSVKREMLLKEVQLVDGYSREFQILKSKFQSFSSMACTRSPPIDKCNNHSANSESNHEVSSDKVNSMRQIIEASSRKIFNLTKFFHTAFKIKGEPTTIETTALVNDLLKRRVRCRFLNQYLKLWQVDDIENSNTHHNAVLNYHNIIAQRIAVDVGSVTNIVLSNELKEETILKNFPNMNAVMAFAFVLTTHASQKNVGQRSLSQGTQITGSVLGNLLDVIEEVQQTRIKLPNLISSRFYTPSAEELELHICFLNFRSGKKVAFALNLSCLGWGIYPTDAIPFELKDVALPKLVAEDLTKIRDAIQSLKAGYSRIFRLCSCVSELVEGWSG